MFIQQLINIRKTSTENLKFGTSLRDRVINGWSALTQQHSRWLFWVADCSKILKSKIKARPVNAGLYLAFKHCISFVAANFGWQWLQFIQNHVRHCFQVVGTVLWKCCAIWLESEQTPFSWKGRPFSLRSAALSRIQFRTCWFVLIKLMNEWMIECSHEYCFGR